MEGYNNIFEVWMDGKLPQEIQSYIDTCFQDGCKTSEACGYFKAGFMVGHRIKEIRKLQGIDDDE